MEQNKNETPDQRIVHKAKVWRGLEKKHECNKSDRDNQRAEYRARRDLSQAIDDAGREL